MTANSFRGAGRVLADVFVDGAPSGTYVEFRQIAQFSLKSQSDIQNATSHDWLDFGQITDSVAIPKEPEFSMKVLQIDKDSLRIALMATASVVAEAAATITDEAVTLQPGVFVPLKYRNLAADGLKVTSVDAATVYVLGKDYDVNFRFGLLRALPGGALAVKTPVLVDYTTHAIASTRLAGARVPSLRAKLLFDGINLVDQHPALATVWDVLLTPQGDVDLMSDKWVELQLNGAMRTPAGKDSPYEVELFEHL